MKKTNKIFALGAFDRFNYGDLLFPIISRNFLSLHYPDIYIDNYALTYSDFSEYGALKTKPISDLYKKNCVSEGDIIYFCGGGILGADWVSMHANLLGEYGNIFLYYMSRILGNKWANRVSQFYFGANSAFPWIAAPTDFSVPVKVIYNAVGGSELALLPEEIKTLALKKLATATYLSVRDRETKKNCAAIENDVVVHVSPDSAVLMSEQFPLSYLESKVKPELMNLLAQGGYVCFHANYNYTKKYINEILVQLETIYHEQGLKTVFLPIGRYVGLDDYKGLAELKEHIKTPAELISDDVAILDVMYTISKASLFVGTSLHGNVTAQSFAVPHIGLTSRKSKLDFYLETWDIPEQAICPQLTDLHRVASHVLAVPASVREQKREQLIYLANENMHNIMKVVLD